MDLANQKRMRIGLLYAVLLLPLIAIGAARSMQSNVNSPIDWVPHTFEPRARYDEFCARFGSGDTLIVGWEGCTLDNPRLDLLTRQLREASLFRNATGEPLIEDVISGREVFAQLLRPAPSAGIAGMSTAVAGERLRGSLVGADLRTTCLVLRFSREGLAQRSALISQIETQVERSCGVPRGQLHLAGPVMDGFSVDQESQRSLSQLAGPSMAVVLLAACVFLRSWRAGMLVFAIAAYCQGATLALVYFGGETMSALLIVLPPLIQVLAVSGGVHLTNYYFDACSENVPQPGIEAVRRGWLPCLLSTGTTAVGMASLMLSELTPIRAFGQFAALGVGVTAMVTLPVLPVLWKYCKVRATGRAVLRGNQPLPSRRPSSRWQWLTRAVAANRWPILSAAATLGLVLAVGLGNVRTSVRIETLFAPRSQLLLDYRWLESRVAELVPIELVVHFDPDAPLTLKQRLALLQQLEQRATQLPWITGSQSAQLFAPTPDQLGRLPAELREFAERQSDAAIRMRAGQCKFLDVDETGEYWRVTLLTSALKRINYSRALHNLDRHLAPVLRDSSGHATAGVSLQTTGVMPLVHAIQQRLLDDLLVSFVTALAIILAVTIVAQAGFLAGAITMIPNVLPTALLFGALGWLDWEVDIGTVMTASVALGIAVDDTFHFLTFFRRGLEITPSRLAAVEYAYRHCGSAMIQTSLICGLGLLVFSISTFSPTSHFALTVVMLIVLALLSDLLLLPALLVSPAGKLFQAALPLPQTDTVQFGPALEPPESFPQAAGNQVSPGTNARPPKSLLTIRRANGSR